MATQDSTPATTARTVPAGEKDTRGMNSVLLYGIGAFALFAVLFVVLDLLNGHL